MLEVKAYQCEHCGKKVLKSKPGMKKHEDKCWLNPLRKSCQSCQHKTTNVLNPSQDGDDRVCVHWCSAEKVELFDRENQKWLLKSDCPSWRQKVGLWSGQVEGAYS